MRYLAVVLLLLTSCATQQDMTQVRATVVTARYVVKDRGVQGISDSFTFEGRIYAHASFTWPTDIDLGAQKVTVKWFNGDQMISTRTSDFNFGRPPHYVWYWTTGTALGTGPCRVEIYLGDRLVGTKAFTVHEARGQPEAPSRGTTGQET